MGGTQDSFRIVTINGGSSSIKFALFKPGEPLTRTLAGTIERIGSPGTNLSASGADAKNSEPEAMPAATHEQAAERLADWLSSRLGHLKIVGIGHRVVHGGIHLVDNRLVTDELVRELRWTQPLDLAHLPREIALIEVFRKRFAGTAQVACFDTAFHKDMPRVAKLLPIPRKNLDAGICRLGFHGLSYQYLLSELKKIAPREAEGCVVFAHLGSGASMAAVKNGKPMDTTMAFTPTAGLVMGTRPGDIDPGLLVYLMRVEKLTPEQMDEFISQRCGLLGVSGTSSDMRDLMEKRQHDVAANEAVELFCYQARKWIGALAAAMGGLDCLVFSAGIGEHSVQARAGICQGLEFLGLQLDAAKNAASASLISDAKSRATIRVIPTDEEITIARVVDAMIKTTN